MDNTPAIHRKKRVYSEYIHCPSVCLTLQNSFKMFCLIDANLYFRLIQYVLIDYILVCGVSNLSLYPTPTPTPYTHTQIMNLPYYEYRKIYRHKFVPILANSETARVDLSFNRAITFI